MKNVRGWLSAWSVVVCDAVLASHDDKCIGISEISAESYVHLAIRFRVALSISRYIRIQCHSRHWAFVILASLLVI